MDELWEKDRPWGEWTWPWLYSAPEEKHVSSVQYPHLQSLVCPDVSPVLLLLPTIIDATIIDGNPCNHEPKSMSPLMR